jgi:hypothetical protein
MRFTFPERVIVGSTPNVIIGAYITAIVAVFLVYPLVVMHGYRTWWVVLFYAIFVGAAIGGSVSHYRIVRRNMRS